MSNAWAGGSTRRWRRTRTRVANRGRWVCQLCGQPISPHLRDPHPRSLAIHHTMGKAHGDDERYLVATHRACNLAAGDPTAAPDPQAQPMTKW